MEQNKLEAKCLKFGTSECNSKSPKEWGSAELAEYYSSCKFVQDAFKTCRFYTGPK